jgi:hypothetical protein
MRSATSPNGKRVRSGCFACLVTAGTCLTKCRCPDAKIDTLLEAQFGAGRLYAAISSRPGQVGRSDGYILEGKELEVGLKLAGPLFDVDGRNDDDPVLFEEVADREAEARVVDNTVLPWWWWWCLGHGEKVAEERVW